MADFVERQEYREDQKEIWDTVNSVKESMTDIRVSVGKIESAVGDMKEMYSLSAEDIKNISELYYGKDGKKGIASKTDNHGTHIGLQWALLCIILVAMLGSMFITPGRTRNEPQATSNSSH